MNVNTVALVFRLLVPFLVVGLLSGVGMASPRVLTLATTEWCPYTCVDVRDRENLIGRYLAELLAEDNIELIVESYPWARAIQLAESGAVDGLLTAVQSEAPSLLFTSVPTAFYQVCFYTFDADWRYESIDDLTTQVLGVIQDYGYTPEIDRYVAQKLDSRWIEAVGGHQSTQRLIRMLQGGRIGVLVEDRLVLASEVRKLGRLPRPLIEAGCAEAQPFFIALSPSLDGVEALINDLNRQLASPSNQVRLRQRMAEIMALKD